MKQEIFFKCIIISIVFTKVPLEIFFLVHPRVHIYSFIIVKINLDLGPNYLWREKQINYYFFNAIREIFFSNCHGLSLASSYLQHYFITNKLKIPSIIDPILNRNKLIKCLHFSTTFGIIFFILCWGEGILPQLIP